MFKWFYKILTTTCCMQVMMFLHDTDTTDLEFSHEIEETSLQIFDVKKEEELIIFPKVPTPGTHM